MHDGFIKVAAGTVDVVVADVEYNTQQIITRVQQADAAGVNLLALPELCLTGFTCGDLFFSDCLLGAVEPALGEILEKTRRLYPVFAVGAPLRYAGKLFNCAVVIHAGTILGVVPKTNLPNYGEFYELRQFSPASVLDGALHTLTLCGQRIPFGAGLIFTCDALRAYTFGVELCEDLWVPCPPSTTLCAQGAAIILNLSASDEIIGKADYRRMLVESTSARLACGYVYASASPTESTQDQVFPRHHMIAENGTMLAENAPFAETELIISDLDVQRIAHERHHVTTYTAQADGHEVPFSQPLRQTALTRVIEPDPFVPPHDGQLRERAEAILQIQSQGLKKRLEHTHAKAAVLGISGGLDSTLALLVCVRAFDLCGRSRREIECVTMPCFGTTHRTKSNAIMLCEQLGVNVREVDITASVLQHFADIGHDEDVHDVTYENAQARERTQVLMDIANELDGLVVGTGDLSELALGWATYNGDHMSMYAVNCSVPKTLVRYIVRYEAQNSAPALRAVLLDILDTPVSPELLPADENGQIAQKTEDLVGPYALHDFYLYHMLRFGTRPRKLYRMAQRAYAGQYSDEVLLHWLKIFCRRFFAQQFKRSCVPDGPKVGTVTLSPRGDWRMPSDASSRLWLKELEQL